MTAVLLNVVSGANIIAHGKLHIVLTNPKISVSVSCILGYTVGENSGPA